jgi:hypothetical protein
MGDDESDPLLFFETSLGFDVKDESRSLDENVFEEN